MKSPLEVLKEYRRNIEVKPISVIEKREEFLEKLKIDLEEELSKSLIQAIEHRPSDNCWIASIRLKHAYASYFHSSHEFLYFLTKNVSIPKGFKEIREKEIRTQSRYNIRTVVYILSLEEDKI